MEGNLLARSCGSSRGQILDDWKELQKGTRPSMVEQNWDGIGVIGLLVDEMNCLTLDLC